MFEFLKSFFGGGDDADLSSLIRNGAKVIDVRSKAEFAAGHAKGSINIPLEHIASKSDSMNRNEVLIVCCRSGNRSASARRILREKGFKQVYNAGAWTNIRRVKP